MYCTCRVETMFVTQHNLEKMVHTHSASFLLALDSSSCLLSTRHMNFHSYLLLYPYLSTSIPPHRPNPISLWILSHTLDSLSLIQCCVLFKFLCTVDFELWMPQAPRRDLRGPAVWPPIYHILPAAMKRQTPSIQHNVRFAAH